MINYIFQWWEIEKPRYRMIYVFGCRAWINHLLWNAIGKLNDITHMNISFLSLRVWYLEIYMLTIDPGNYSWSDVYWRFLLLRLGVGLLYRRIPYFLAKVWGDRVISSLSRHVQCYAHTLTCYINVFNIWLFAMLSKPNIYFPAVSYVHFDCWCNPRLMIVDAWLRSVDKNTSIY